MQTKISISRQANVDSNIDWHNFKINHLDDPVEDMDAVNLRTLNTSIANALTTSQNIVIGAPEDGDYSDGLFDDFTPTTTVGAAVDRFNEVLKSLAPKPAPELKTATKTGTGYYGKVSFDSSHQINGYNNDVKKVVKSGNTFSLVPMTIGTAVTRDDYNHGIVSEVSSLSGYLAGDVEPDHENGIPFPNRAFLATETPNTLLVLKINGVDIQSVDLGTFTSGNAKNANGTGFTITAPVPVKFSNGDAFESIKYRTGTWNVDNNDLIGGCNIIEIAVNSTPIFMCSVIVDKDAENTVYENATLSNLQMSGDRKISGVSYHTGGSCNYSVEIENAYTTTHSTASNALNYTGTSLSITDESLPACVDPDQIITVTNKPATITSSRLINAGVSVRTSVDRVFSVNEVTGGDASISGILLDATADNSTTSIVRFNGENRRIHSGLDITSTAYSATTSPAQWASTQNLISGDANHNTGLLVYNGGLQYPKIDFSTLALNGPNGNPDYSTASGQRTFYGFFYNSLSYSNFSLNVSASSTSFVPVSTGVSGNSLTLEILAPNTTKDANGVVVWKDAVVPHSGDDADVGCFASTYGNSIPTNWGCTLGTKNTSMSGNVIVFRITASEAWTGKINSVSINWL